MEQLTIKEYITLMYWFMFDTFKYEQYEYWLNLGLLPKYAFEAVHKI